MDALDRVMRIRPDLSPSNWSELDFQLAKVEGYQRWREIQRVLEINYRLFGDAVELIVPDFKLPANEECAAMSVEVPRAGGNCPNQAIVWFVKWERCPVTSGLPNPYEPWIEVWEHGGALSVEHGNFVDVTFREPGEDGRLQWA